MKEIIKLLKSAVAYTNLELEQEPDGHFERRVINKELVCYRNAIASNISAWDCILFEGRQSDIVEYTCTVYPLLLSTIERICFLISLNEATKQFDQDSIIVTYDATYELCLDILRHMAPDAVKQFHDALIHPHK